MCVVLKLQSHGALPSSDQHGFTPLHYACMCGHPKIVDLFLLRGARTDIVNMGGNSLLHLASQYGKYDVLIKVREKRRTPLDRLTIRVVGMHSGCLVM